MAVATHEIPGRLRLRVPSRKYDAEYFHVVEQGMKNLQGILEVHTNAATGSVLLVHQLPIETITQHALLLKLFEVGKRETPPARSLSQYVEQAIAAEGIAENLIRVDPRFRGIALGALVGAGLYQAVRGSFLPAGMTLFAYAIYVLNHSRT